MNTLALRVTLAVGSMCLLFPALAGAKDRIYCPYCHHWMTTKKTRAHFVAVKVSQDGPTYYCCRCDMPKKWLVQKAKKLGKA